MGNIPSGLAKAAPIHEAAASDNVEKLVALLADGESVDAVDGVRVFFFLRGIGEAERQLVPQTKP